jgi:glycosyltransferase involved in cell wall biosynthesis
LAHIAWLGKKSPFCGNVTYGLTTTEQLRQRGHRISFIHFDTPATGPGLPWDPPSVNGKGLTLTKEALRASRRAALAGDESEVALPYLLKSQVYTVPAPGAQRELRESLEQLKPDLVHASLTLSPLDFLLPDLCQQLGVPLVATFHPAFDAGLRNLAGGTQQLTYQLYAPALARFNRVIVFSELQAEVLSRLGVKDDRLAVIPNGVDTDVWQPADFERTDSERSGAERNSSERSSSERSSSALRREVQARCEGRRPFLYMGRLATEKNVEALLRAWRLVRPAGCVLVIVGDGPLRGSLQAAHEDPDILWWGYEPALERRVALLQASEVFLLPSLVEGLSLSLLEAMASGTACVATDAGADGEVLEGGAGIVISTQGVTTQLRTLLPVLRDQPVLTAELGRRARERALQRYTLTRNIEALERVYAELVPSPALAA